MSNQYHYLVAGLPDLLFDDSKLQTSLIQFREVIAESVEESDQVYIRLFFYRYDNQNILKRLQDPECEIDPKGNLSSDELDQIFLSAKEGSFSTDISGVPDYIDEFLTAHINETPVFANKSWDLQLSELYYNYSVSTDNKYISNWFNFERNLTNLITASQCKKYDVSGTNQLIGAGEIVEKLERSNARDFGLDNDFPFLNEILKALEENDLKDFELKLDRVKWDYLDSEVFFFYFTIERIFSYLIKLSIIDRWLSLDKETGRKLFNELVSNMEATYEFPEEFKLKK